jgi:DNA-binding transcriptional ArsR family regulator
MDDLSATLLDRLIEKTFEDMSQEDKLTFVEKLFGEMKPESQERFLLHLIKATAEEAPASTQLPSFVRVQMIDDDLQDIGPWRMCCRMMADIDQAAMDSLDAAEPARLFQALADESRIKIIKLLTDGERCVDDLTQVLDTAQSTVSHHLRILREAGLITGDKRGRSIYYHLTHPVKIVVE